MGFRCPLCGELFRIGAAELEAIAGSRQIGLQLAMDELWQTVEEHLFDADVVVEVLHLGEGNSRAHGMRMESRRGVR